MINFLNRCILTLNWLQLFKLEGRTVHASKSVIQLDKITAANYHFSIVNNDYEKGRLSVKWL